MGDAVPHSPTASIVSCSQRLPCARPPPVRVARRRRLDLEESILDRRDGCLRTDGSHHRLGSWHYLISDFRAAPLRNRAPAMKLAQIPKVITGAAATLRAGQICTRPSGWVRLAMPHLDGPGDEGPGRLQQEGSRELIRIGRGAARERLALASTIHAAGLSATYTAARKPLCRRRRFTKGGQQDTW